MGLGDMIKMAGSKNLENSNIVTQTLRGGPWTLAAVTGVGSEGSQAGGGQAFKGGYGRCGA